MVLPFTQVWEGGARHVEVAVEIGLKRFIKTCVGNIQQRIRMLLERSIVVQDIELAESLHYLLYSIVAKRRFLDIADDHDSALSFCLDPP